MGEIGAGSGLPEMGSGGSPAWRNELAGHVHGSAVQAGSIHGDVYFGATAPGRMPVPSQLPPPPAHFTDRSGELADLDRLMGENDPARPATLVVVTGVGGVGKTSLATRWLHQGRKHFPDGQLYADLRGFGSGEPVRPADVLGRFMRALGVPPDRIPVGLAEQAPLYRSITAGRAIVTLLDNAASAAQVRVLLPGAGSSLVVVTTRRRLAGLALDGARFLDVSPLDEQAAVELFGRIAGVGRTQSQPGAARAVVRLCGLLPLAVCVAAARLAPYPTWPLQRAAEELAGEQHRPSALSVEDISVRTILDASYQALAPAVARAYRLLAQIPGPGFGPGAAAAALGCAPAEGGRLLSLLVEASLLEETGQQSWRFHDLVRLHAREQAQTDPADDRRAAVARIVDWYLRTAVAADLTVIPGRWHLGSGYERAQQEPPAFSGPAQALDWLESELPGLLAALRLAHEEGMHDKAWQLCEALWGLFVYRRPYRDWLEAHALGLASARVCGD
ncbi:MAG TPA: hypothetical protein VIV12_15790, partial [Streptosporangiaceae bacterium]